jgi:hypothetical protein
MNSLEEQERWLLKTPNKGEERGRYVMMNSPEKQEIWCGETKLTKRGLEKYAGMNSLEEWRVLEITELDETEEWKKYVIMNPVQIIRSSHSIKESDS